MKLQMDGAQMDIGMMTTTGTADIGTQTQLHSTADLGLTKMTTRGLQMQLHTKMDFGTTTMNFTPLISSAITVLVPTQHLCTLESMLKGMSGTTYLPMTITTEVVFMMPMIFIMFEKLKSCIY